MKTIKTRIYTYNLNIKGHQNTAELEDYNALVETLRSEENRGHWLNCHADGSSHISWDNGQEIELETSCVFDNQWNTRCGKRVFDWYEGVYPNSGIKQGHYLEITPEMVAIRQNTAKCGYCGAIHALPSELTFCNKCLDSGYLEENNLKLLRLRPIATCLKKHVSFPELSDTEKADLLPLYKEAQLHGSTKQGKERLIAKRAKMLADRDNKIAEANKKYDGFLWLMDHGIKSDNCIYYSHTDTFTFGWRTALSEDIADALRDEMAEFPFNYSIVGV